MKTRLVLIACLLLVGLLAGACGTVVPYAAKVNGTRITTRDLDRELKAIRGNEKYLEAVESQLAVEGRRVLGVGEGTFSTGFVSQVLTRRILLELVHQEVGKRGLRVSRDQQQQARQQLEQSFGDPALLQRFPKAYIDELVLRTAEVDVLQAELTKGGVSAADVKEFYDENPSFFEQMCARQIVIGQFEPGAPVPPEQDAQAKATAEDVRRRVDTGQDFAAIARAESKDARTAPAGGDMGCVVADALPPAVAGALADAQPGGLVGPVRSDTGYHVVQLTERKKQPLAEATPQIRQYLESQSQDVLNEFIQTAVTKADITVNPRYGSFDKRGPSVVPPEAPATSTTVPLGSVPPPVPSQ